MKTTILLSVFALGISDLNAQDTSKTNPLTISGYVEAYYSYDLGNPVQHERPPFFYSYNRHIETNLNLAFVKANYTTEKVRGNIALMAGTYPQYNTKYKYILVLSASPFSPILLKKIVP